MGFPEILKELRESRDIRQEDLAKYLNVSRPTVAGYETGRREPDYNKLVMLSEYFHVSIDFLLTGKSPEEFMPVAPTPEMEAMLDRRVLSIYRKLGFSSKQDVLEYVQLLELKENQND